MRVENYFLFRVKYFLPCEGVVYSTVLARTSEEAENIVTNCPVVKKFKSGGIIESINLNPVTHVSPSLLLELFSAPSST
jgi:hypothetical protein